MKLQFYDNLLLYLSFTEQNYFITSLAKGGYVFGSVGLSVCLLVCGQHYSKTNERIGMKFNGGSWVVQCNCVILISVLSIVIPLIYVCSRM